MHLLNVTTASLDDLIEPVDLGQAPGEVVMASFSDSDLGALAAAWREGMPELRLTRLADLRHPMSVDLWVEKVAAAARVVVVRLLGGYDWWAYGCDRLAEVAREKGVALALLPGECREDDARLAALSTAEGRGELLGYFREGGPGNMAALLERLAGREAPGPAVVPKAGVWGKEPAAEVKGGRPVVPILFYRSMWLAGDAAPVEALVAALAAEGIAGVPVFVASLRDVESLAVVEAVVGRLKPAALVTATAFASEGGVFERWGVPVFQVIPAVTRREAWEGGQRGLAPADLAMHVVLPELDGRILAGAVSFKDAGARDERFGLALQVNRAEPDRVAQVARRIGAFLRMQAMPRGERRVAVLIPDYPAVAGRTGYAVGLDVPGSVLAILADLEGAGYGVEGVPGTARELMRLVEVAAEEVVIEGYRTPGGVEAVWGAAEGPFRFRAVRFGKVVVALAPDRGRGADRRADYHDPVLPPRHELVAFGQWLQRECDVVVHVGAHGTLEWLPGKTVALSSGCYPEVVTGALPVVYPFIVSNPGEAAQAKRRIAAVTLGHLTAPLVGAEPGGGARALERLVDEYAQAEGLDRRRRERLAGLIVAEARKSGLAGEAGVGEADDPERALVRIDAWLCDLKDLAVKDGLHVYGRAAPGEEGERLACAAAERDGLLAALDGRHVAPGPAGAPGRGRRDVLPTGRNLYAVDPRGLPTATAWDLGRAAADEAVRRFAQEHGDWPRALVVDLWGSASLRTGGEEIAMGLALMGCRPVWDEATGRVTGVEVLPPAVLRRPRVDVTWRISGLFRDMFASQIALIDAAVAAVAAREETVEENPLRAAGPRPMRVFGSAPGTFGAGVEE
ncbi:MAG TPA: cobaltochelatase subunit CobN, partial [Amaricoccus sp.]|nr:cobaltochelatase subunit CobN [Amaricoccus sp.]